MSEIKEVLEEQTQDDTLQNEKFADSIESMLRIMSPFWVKTIINLVIFVLILFKTSLIIILPTFALFGVTSLKYTAFSTLCMIIYQCYESFKANRELFKSIK